MENKDRDNTIHTLGKEVKLLKGEKSISRTNTKGEILYFNHTFSKISHYNKKELSHTPHNILRHPDMPKTIFYLIWKSLLAGRNTHAIIKNLTKEGNYYWQQINFSIQKDNENRTISFLSEGVQAHKKTIKVVEPMYQELLEIEKHNTDDAINFFLNFLNANNIATYSDYIFRISPKRRKPQLLKSWSGFFF